jgi:hypothetical protein
MGLGQKAALVGGDAQKPGQALASIAGHCRRRQHHQVCSHAQRLAGQRVGAPHLQPVAVPDDLGHLPAQVNDAGILYRPLDELVVSHPLGANVDVENISLTLRHRLPVGRGLLGYIHAADLGAVGVVPFGRAGAGALHPDHFSGNTAIGGTADVSSL